MKFIFFLLVMGLSQGALSESMDAVTWKRQLGLSMKEEMCKSSGYLMSCFAINETACKTAVVRAFNPCFDIGGKKTIDSTGEGVSLAYKQGLCVGDSLEKSLKSKKHETRDCGNAKKWL